MSEKVIIPKDCLLCDVCNKQLTDENFIALEDMLWCEGWLYCGDCEKKNDPKKFLKVIDFLLKGADLSKTDLARPMVIEFG